MDQQWIINNNNTMCNSNNKCNKIIKQKFTVCLNVLPFICHSTRVTHYLKASVLCHIIKAQEDSNSTQHSIFVGLSSESFCNHAGFGKMPALPPLYENVFIFQHKTQRNNKKWEKKFTKKKKETKKVCL